MRLYHGSSVAVERPDVSRNTGFADLGQGFYLTDDLQVAIGRARSRARVDEVAHGVVSVFEFDEDALGWAVWDGEAPVLRPLDSQGQGAACGMLPSGAFGLRFAPTGDGIATWTEYIRGCRKGESALPGLGEPAVTRAWIATDEVEMICSGFAAASDIAPYIDISALVVQYCFRDQRVLDATLRFVEGVEA